MNRWITRALQIGAFAIGGLIVSGGAAQANVTQYNAGAFNGNQTSIAVQAPINACGNAIAILGFANGSCGGGAVANANGAGGNWVSGHSTGFLNSNQTTFGLQLRINACGNAVALAGSAHASCAAGAAANASGHHYRHHHGGNATANGTRHHRHHHAGNATANGTKHHRHHRHHKKH